jgi:tRNA pseudouridine55 synthase
MSIHGVLLIDKPAGPTSHDVVARLRRTSGERRIGHTGTLDPLATGLLPLVFGRATRLASALSGRDKTYEALIRLGVATDTDDAQGRPVGAPSTSWPDDLEVDAALAALRGSHEQVPPQHSAKKVGGRKAYELARHDRAVELKPVPVTVHALERLAREAPDLVSVRILVSAGFYVRALARDLGRALGCGAHLAALRRTSVGAFDVGSALSLEAAERLGREVESRVIPPADALPDLPSLRVSDPGLRRVVHGNPIGPEHVTGSPALLEGPGDVAGAGQRPAERALIRLIGPDGRLLALAEARHGILHPVVVLG